MREEKTIEIQGADGVTYEYNVRQAPPMKSLRTLTELVKMIGPAFAPIASNVGQFAALLDRDVEDIKTEFLGEAVKALSHGLDADAIERVVLALAANTQVRQQVEGAKFVDLSKCLDVHFMSAGLGAMFRWVPFALQVQYDDFFTVLANASKSVLPRASKKPDQA